MEYQRKIKVPVTSEDRQKSYFKYYERDLVQGDPKLYEKALSGPVDPKNALLFSERNRLFEPGNQEEEIGYCTMEDGTAYMACRIIMPRVTAEMFDWWFAWHGLDNLRYKIWDSEDHYIAQCLNPEIAGNTSLSYKERYQDTIHYIEEDLGAGKDSTYLHFMKPEDFGFSQDLIGTPACATLVCARSFMNGKPNDSDPSNAMVHFTRETDLGLELRSRFWLGWSIREGKDFKTIPPGVRIPETVPKMMLLHCIKEFSNLAAILPEVFAEEAPKEKLL